MNHNQEATAFEELARRYLSEKWKVELKVRQVRFTNTCAKKFDLVSEDFRYIGDAKYLKNIAVPAAKWSTIAEYVWLLEKTSAQHKFLVFGKDKEVAARWLERYGSLVRGVEFYFFDGIVLEGLN